MTNDLLGKKEDDKFTNFVIAYNKTPKEERNKKDEEFIKERFKRLIYLIPKNTLYLDDDLLNSLYLVLNEEMDKIISSYSISSYSFNSYLRNISIYRARRIYQKRNEDSLYHDAYCRELEPYYTEENLLDFPQEKINSPIIFKPPSKLNTITLPTLSKIIISQTNENKSKVKNQKEEMLKIRLTNRRVRECFLFFILSLPRSDDDTDAENFSRVLGIDKIVMHRFLELKNQYSPPDYKDKEIKLIAKRWRIMTRMKRGMATSTTKEDYLVFKENYLIQVKRHNDLLEKYYRPQRGLSHETIAKIYSKSRTSVTMAIGQFKEELRRINQSF